MDTNATVVNFIMAVLTILVRRPRSEFVPGHKLRVVSAAPFIKETRDGFLKDFGVERAIEGYGMTEIPGAFSNPYEGPSKVATMGKPGVHADPAVVWTQARIIDDKDIIRRRGENVAGAELDRVIAEHPAVSEVAAIAVEAELGEDEILAAVVKKNGHSLEEAEIRDWCAARLAAHKVPRFVVLVDELPHTPTHKVAKFLLKQDASLRAKAVDFQPI